MYGVCLCSWCVQVWEASVKPDGTQGGSLAEYVAAYTRLLARALLCNAQRPRTAAATAGVIGGCSSRSRREPYARMESRVRSALEARKIVLCNKSDLTPCPVTESAALGGSIFLAGSAQRGTNMRELWRLVCVCAAPRQQSNLSRS